MWAREVTTRALVLAQHPSGEGSMRVVLYSEQLGLVRVSARSAREERSKLRPFLIPGTRGTYSLVRGRGEWRMTGVVGGRSSYFECTPDASASGVRILELVRHLVHGESPDAELFTVLWEFFEVLPTMGTDVRIAEYVVALRILAALGYVAPETAGDFLGTSYEAAFIARAAVRRAALVRIINEALSASQL